MEEKIYKPNIDNRGTPPKGDDFMENKELETWLSETKAKNLILEELIESEINLLKSKIDSAAKDKLYQRASNLEYELCGMSKILNKIKNIK